MTGSETMSDGFTKVYAFHVPQGGGKEAFLAGASKVGGLVRAQGYPVCEGAVAGIRREIGGSWTMQAYDIAEGEVIKLSVSKRAAWNSKISSAQVLIRMRSEGAHTRITIPLLARAGKSRFTEAVFDGRFEVITPQEAFAAAGVTVPSMFLRLFTLSAQETCFKVSQVEEAVKPAERIKVRVIQDNAGATVAVRERVRRRSLDL
jgi:hypothetical protein